MRVLNKILMEVREWQGGMHNKNKEWSNGSVEYNLKRR
jgi:hypothetical protein